MTGPLGTIYSLQEAADYLKASKQAVARAARRHGLGAVFGRHIRFTEDDVKAVYEALRIRGRELPVPPVGRVTESYLSLRKLARAQREERVRQRATQKGGSNEKR
ncbi:DNA binding domain-containing protein, excisionase family OS=Bosea thiooxidans OX=53254 GN=SAMN05660750_04072 PE=4 SV=1 [Bosea thiooxidans]|uniref:DNA binding domain-containing protein, excisionase family n=1 Tax=Bosea thiooxidans TaxID=53254 RepID=A0A1T5GI43_9HYPH|nr:helix-turn-helix domain-containing protein [Bosea thiooxidans]SKC08061.1 DNA binding domain-containing protein, excisionase family [Bosea thiooxidans]